jgi:hypothetical protein
MARSKSISTTGTKIVSSRLPARLAKCKDCGSSSRKLPHPGPRCATCHRNRRTSVSEARRLTYVAKQYNLTPEAYEALRERYSGLCWLCRRNRGRQVDHDHKCCVGKTSCGKCVRGLLCGPCNKFLGHIRDNPEIAMNIVTYLDEYKTQRMLREKEGDHVR